ncbi:hypothetical protein PS2_004595 [Malus domestica]
MEGGSSLPRHLDKKNRIKTILQKPSSLFSIFAPPLLVANHFTSCSSVKFCFCNMSLLWDYLSSGPSTFFLDGCFDKGCELPDNYSADTASHKRCKGETIKSIRPNSFK